MRKRRSVRKFKSKPVPWDNIVNMMHCAINAPCAGNAFSTKFIVVQEQEGKDSIASHCHDQSWIATAPVIIAVVAEPETQHRHYGTRGEKLYTIQNAAACTMNLINAAESLGLATCWVGAFDEEALRKDLGLPEYVNVHAILPVGFADETPKAPIKPWIRSMVYLEKWWSGSKNPPLGYYSQNVMKTTKKTGDAIKKVAEKILGKN